MKSIVEEGSSITKAIENGWIKAGKPTEFSIKIFEEAKKNFLGLTTKSAKIGIFFGEQKAEQPTQARPKREPRPQQPHHQQQRSHERSYVEQPKREFVKKNIQKVEEQPQERTVIWTDSMVEDVQTWLKDSLNMANLKAPDYTVESHMFHLKINFNNPLFDDKLREKYLFSSVSLLFLQMLKNKYKRPLKGYKIILSS